MKLSRLARMALPATAVVEATATARDAAKTVGKAAARAADGLSSVAADAGDALRAHAEPASRDLAAARDRSEANPEREPGVRNLRGDIRDGRFDAVRERLERAIDEAKESVEDDQSEIQFQIQLATSDLQNAENTRSQAEKCLDEQRKSLTRNWDG